MSEIKTGSQWIFAATVWTMKDWNEEWVTFSHPLAEDWKLATSQFLKALNTGLLERFES